MSASADDGGISSDDDDAADSTTATLLRTTELLRAELLLGRLPPRATRKLPAAAAVSPSSAPEHLLPPPRLAHDAHGLADFLRLPPKTDLTLARRPSRRGWDAEAEDGPALLRSLADEVDALRLLPELRSAALTQEGDRVDFIAPAENMKAFFKLLHNESAVSLAVHRVGNSLVLEGLELDDADASTSAGSGSSTPTAAAAAPLQLARKSIHDNFLTYTLGADGAAGGGRAAPATLDLGDGDAADGDDDSDDDEREEWMPPRRPPRGFRRVLRWQLDDLSLLLGSDTVVYRSEHAQGRSSLDTSRSSDGYHSPGFSVKLHDENSSATSLVCLDYWLDNVMSNASDVALCLQKDGVVQGYRVVPTEQLPAAGGLGDGFSPAAVTDCAVSVLRFLRQHCTREAGTYWLVRRAGEQSFSLFDISEWGPMSEEGDTDATAATGDAAAEPAAAPAAEPRRRPQAAPEAAAPAPEPTEPADASGGAAAAGSGGGHHPFAVPVALLCWRIAEQLTAPHEDAPPPPPRVVRGAARAPAGRPPRAADADGRRRPRGPRRRLVARGARADERLPALHAAGRRRRKVAGRGRKSATGAHGAAARALLRGVEALREVTWRYGASPPLGRAAAARRSSTARPRAAGARLPPRAPRRPRGRRPSSAPRRRPSCMSPRRGSGDRRRGARRRRGGRDAPLPRRQALPQSRARRRCRGWVRRHPPTFGGPEENAARRRAAGAALGDDAPGDGTAEDVVGLGAATQDAERRWRSRRRTAFAAVLLHHARRLAPMSARSPPRSPTTSPPPAA